MLKDYYSISEAGKYLTEINGKTISDIDVLEKAARGDFRLCIWLKCVVARFNFPFSDSDVAIKNFKGYVQIPKAHIEPNLKSFGISYAEPMEVFKEPDGGHHVFNNKIRHVISRLNDQDKYNGRFIVMTSAEADKNLRVDSIVVNPEEAWIPEQDLLDFASKTKQQSINTLQKNMPESAVQSIQEGGRMNHVIYQKLRAYCMQDIRQYIGLNIDDVFREMLSKSAKNELLALVADEKRIALSLFQSIDLTPREVAASYLLAVISNYRIITWHREPRPPHGHKQSPPLKKTEEDTLTHQTSQAISEYVCYLPEREADALLLAWEASLAPKSTQDTAKPELEISKTNPWKIVDPRDPEPEHTWYTAARYFARQLVKESPTLLNKKDRLAQKVVQSLTGVGIKKRGGKKPFDPGTVKKAFHNVNLG